MDRPTGQWKLWREGALLVLVACGPPESGIRNLLPIAAVFPEALEFGPVGPPLEATAEIVVKNPGSADLEVTGDLEGGGGAITLVDGPVDLVVEPGSEVAIPVRFAPTTYRAYAAELELRTNDETHPRIEVPVTGEGVDLPFPDVDVEPGRTVTVADVPVGDSELLVFDVVNRGDADLEVLEAALEGPSVFAVRVDPTGTRVAPGERTTVIVAYTPPDEDGHLATFHLATNDPDEPAVDVLLVGNGGGTELVQPVAVIEPCPAVVDLTGPETVRFSGAASYDPGQLLPLTYDWAVTRRPEASDRDLRLDPDTTREVDLRVDVAGTWEVLLQVANALETPSLPTVCTFEAIPEDDLHVELSWDTPSADIDLHLLRSGSGWFELPGDCNYCNRNPSWGAAGSDDDPRLDIDDRGGFGPENINILHPADDTYDVRVHYFAPNGDGPVQATVKVWLNGAETWTGTRVLTRSQVWDVGTITWPEAVFDPDVAPNVIPPGPVGCR